jgi:general transcription factor 3C polypeptide 3 (transcription factor C subunit 4)
VLDYADLYRAATTALVDAKAYDDAMIFLRAIEEHVELRDQLLWLNLGKCYRGMKLHREAEESFLNVIHVEDDNVDALRQLADLYEEIGEQDQALFYVNQVITVNRSRASHRRRRPRADGDKGESLMPTEVGKRSYYRPKRLAVDPEERYRAERLREEYLRTQFDLIKEHQQGMEAGIIESVTTWMKAAHDLIADFRGCKKLYPWEKFVQFLGYKSAAKQRAQEENPDTDPELQAMADRLSQSEMHFIHVIVFIANQAQLQIWGQV